MAYVDSIFDKARQFEDDAIYLLDLYPDSPQQVQLAIAKLQAAQALRERANRLAGVK